MSSRATNAATVRVVGEVSSRSSHDSAPPTVAHRKPTRPQPTATVVTAMTTLMTASVTISPPYCDQRLSPASMPSSVACRQKPASPADSRITDSNRDSTNTWGDHRMAVAAITAAGDHPDSRGNPHRVGDGSAAVRIDMGGDADLAGGLLQQSVRRAGDQTESPPEHAEHREAGGIEFTRGEVQHRITAQCGDHGRHTHPRDAAASHRASRRPRVRHNSGTGVEYSQASHSGRSEVCAYWPARPVKSSVTTVE